MVEFLTYEQSAPEVLSLFRFGAEATEDQKRLLSAELRLSENSRDEIDGEADYREGN